MSVASNVATDTVESKGFDDPDLTRNAKFLKLNAECVRECRVEAAITLAAIYRQSGTKGNYNKIEDIAAMTGVHRDTVGRHFKKLEEHGWIDRKGRQRRRTVTRAVSKRALSPSSSEEWNLKLPVWSLALDLKPSELLLLAISFHRVTGLTNDLDGMPDDCFHDPYEYEWTMKHITELTGLTRNSVKNSRQSLIERGMLADETIYGKVVLIPRSHHNEFENVFVTEDAFDGLDLSRVGLLCQKCRSGVSKVPSQSVKSAGCSDLNDPDLNDPKILNAETAVPACVSSSISLEEERKVKTTKRPFHRRLIALSGRKPSRCDDNQWKNSLDGLIKNGHDPKEIERVFLFAKNKDKWFSSVDPKREFPIRHFARCYSSLSKRACRQGQAA
ncbi:helix-turn-helix domain-containing protein [Rhodopirellula bahusiensis]|uniref:helix-turn-helix domain-containing protein n=1 Tax=Rhodopirellula bahusiensis TaxID=2014065 RepID=UPI0032637C82